MAELKTKPNEMDVTEFLNRVADPVRRADSLALLALFKEALNLPPRMWGDAIIGFGDTHLKYESGRELDWFITGFSPRKQALTLYLNLYAKRDETLFARLGKYKTGKGCLYITRLADVDQAVLIELLRGQL